MAENTNQIEQLTATNIELQKELIISTQEMIDA